MSFRRSVVLSLAWVVAAVLAAGCATIGEVARPVEEVVLERAQARWNALLKRDWAAAYQYLTPAYRLIVPLDRYGDQFGGPLKWEGVTARSAKCEEKRCVVAVEVSFRMLLPGHRDRVSATNFDETWVFEDSQWFKFEPL